MTRYYLNVYHPLITTAFGCKARSSKDLYPFVDGSIRREPDLEHCYPPITCLCRADKFAPRLEVMDIVAYMTIKGMYGNENVKHYRLTAVLQIIKKLNSHEEGAKWYKEKGMLLPSNCMADGNPSKSFSESNGGKLISTRWSDEVKRRCWDAGYLKRAKQHPIFLICNPLFIDLSMNAPVVTVESLKKHFGRVPGMRNPTSFPQEQFYNFLSSLLKPEEFSSVWSVPKIQ